MGIFKFVKVGACGPGPGLKAAAQFFGIGIGIVLLEAQQADLPYYRESHVQEVTRMKKERKQNRKD